MGLVLGSGSTRRGWLSGASGAPSWCEGNDPVAFTTNTVIRGLARRIGDLNDEMHTIDHALRGLIGQTAPSLLDCYGIGVDTAATLLVTAGDKPDRLHTERSWAHLCGVTPVPTGSGKTSGRVRLNHGGDPQLRQEAPSRRTVDSRDHALPETLRRPPNVQTPPPNRITIRRVGSDPTIRLTHPSWCCPHKDLSTPPAVRQSGVTS